MTRIMQMPSLTTLISAVTWTKVILVEDLDRELGEGMGENKRIRRKIASLERRIAQHEEKIKVEQAKLRPRHWRIEYWQKEITSWSEQVSRLHRRLPQARKKDD